MVGRLNEIMKFQKPVEFINFFGYVCNVEDCVILRKELNPLP